MRTMRMVCRRDLISFSGAGGALFYGGTGMDAEEPVYLCVDCLERKPLDQFRRRKRGEECRHYECRSCANRYLREWRAKRRRERLNNAVVDLHRYRESPGQMEYLAAVVIALFHGAAGVAAEYAKAFDAALDAGDHKAVARYLLGLTDFLWVAEQAQARRTLAEDKRKLKREAMRRAGKAHC